MKTEKRVVDFNDIKNEIQWFIEKIKEKSSNEEQNYVYVVKFFEGNKDGQYCVTMGYIEGSLLISHIERFKYYFYLNEDLIILDYNIGFKEKYKF